MDPLPEGDVLEREGSAPAREDGQQPEDAKQAGEHDQGWRPRLAWNHAVLKHPGTHIPLAELDAYTKNAIAGKLIDQEVRDVNIGKAHVGIGMAYRGRLDKPQRDSVAAPPGLAAHQLKAGDLVVSPAGTGQHFT